MLILHDIGSWVTLFWWIYFKQLKGSLFLQASELLNHPHLQPYILKIHLKLNSPRRSTFPFQWPESNYMRRTRFVVPDSVSTLSDQDKCLPLSNDRSLNPSISETEQDSQCFTQKAHGLSTSSKEVYEVSVGGACGPWNTNKTKSSTVERTPRSRADKDSTAARRQTMGPSKIPRTGSKHDAVSLSSAGLNVLIYLGGFHENIMKKNELMLTF